MLEFTDVDVHYGKIRVLKHLSIKVGDGEVVSLIGANAAGKTTTLRAMMGLKETSAGRLRFNGEDLSTLSTPQRVHCGLALVPEGRQVFTKFTVLENLLMGAYHRSDRDKLDTELAYAFQLFPRLAERRSQKAGSLSGGEQQMLAIARGLMAKPKCLLLDEPTLGLAPIIVEELVRVIGALAREGMTILLAEQNAVVALGCARRAYVLESGTISLQGDSQDLRKTDAVKNLYLGG